MSEMPVTTTHDTGRSANISNSLPSVLAYFWISYPILLYPFPIHLYTDLNYPILFYPMTVKSISLSDTESTWRKHKYIHDEDIKTKKTKKIASVVFVTLLLTSFIILIAVQWFYYD